MTATTPRGIRYYDLKRHWTKRIMPHLANTKLNDTLVENFNKFIWGRWRKQFKHGELPFAYESCDWWCEHRGPMPRYSQYVKHSACHWLVNWALELAQLVEPKRQWRIITSDRHSTVWDGEQLLFDFNFQALGVSPEECFTLAHEQELKPGELLLVHMAEHYTKDRPAIELSDAEARAAIRRCHTDPEFRARVIGRFS
jgi:hypothetical protein